MQRKNRKLSSTLKIAMLWHAILWTSNKKPEKVRSAQGPCEPTDEHKSKAKICKYKQWLIELWKTKNIKTRPLRLICEESSKSKFNLKNNHTWHNSMWWNMRSLSLDPQILLKYKCTIPLKSESLTTYKTFNSSMDGKSLRTRAQK